MSWQCRAATYMREESSRLRVAAPLVTSPNGTGVVGQRWVRAPTGLCLRWQCLATTCMRGGNFTTAGGKVSGYVARAYLPTLPTLSVLGSDTNVILSWPSVD